MREVVTVRRQEMLQVLLEVVAKRRPELLPLAKKVGVEVLTEEQLETLSDVVLQEFVEEGLQENDEPNPRGIVLDDVMGFLVPHECNPKNKA